MIPTLDINESVPIIFTDSQPLNKFVKYGNSDKVCLTHQSSQCNYMKENIMAWTKYNRCCVWYSSIFRDPGEWGTDVIA